MKYRINSRDTGFNKVGIFFVLWPHLYYFLDNLEVERFDKAYVYNERNESESNNV